MKKSFLLLLILLCIGARHAPAHLYRYLETEDGLSSRRVIAVEKDLKGYMWFLTLEGVDRYNGKQYTHYPLSVDGKLIQQFPNLSSLYVDRSGGIWVTGKNGYVFNYDPMQDTYRLAFHFPDSVKTNKRLPITHTYMDREDQLWLCTKNAQYIYHAQQHTFSRIDSPINEEITFLTQGKANEYFIGTNHNIYLAQLSGNSLTIKTNPLLENFHIIQHLYFHESTGSLLIGTLMDGFYLYDTQAATLESIGNLKDVTINAVTDDFQSTENVLVATDGNGVYRLNMKTKELSPYLSAGNDTSNRMNGDIIKDICIDEEGRIWLAVFPTSITVYSEKYPDYAWLKNTANNQITYLLEDTDGDLWAATNNGVSYYNTRTHQWKHLLGSDQQMEHAQNNVFVSLCEITPGTILVGGYMSGMYRINKKDMKPHYFFPQAEGYSHIRPDKYIRSIYKDEEGNVWAGGYYNFKRIAPNTGRMKHYTTEYPITYITSKSKDELWVGTTNGLYKFDKRTQRMQEMNLSPEIGTVNTIYQDADKATYIGTHGSGIWVYNNQNGAINNYDTRNSALICNNIYCILPSSDKEKLIISTENELVCFNTKEKIFLNWTKEQGLFSAKFNTAAGIRSRKGNVLFGSDEGIFIISDTIDLPREFHSKLVFSEFNIHYQKITPNSERSPLSKPIDETTEIVLSHDKNIFSFDVSSINYDCPSRILYSWKLEGFYNEWTIPSESHLIRYTNIEPGNYTLKVRSILLDDGHVLEERHIGITVTPPFHRTTWAYLIYTVLGLLLIAGVIRLIWLRKDKNVSNEKIQFFINTAHDIRTPLTLIKAPLNELNNHEQLSEEGKKNLNMAIQSTDKLSELATKLIEFQKEELYSSTINVSQCEINTYIQEFLKQFGLYAEKKNLTLTYKGTEEPLEAWIDKNKTDSILHNLVSNALKYTPEGGSVTIKVSSNSNYWFLCITDTGIGISNSDQKKLFKRLFRGDNAVNLQITGTGIGLLQTYKLIKRHQGKISVTSKENVGTTFRLRFPIDNSKYKHHVEIPSEASGTFMVDKTHTDVAAKHTAPATAATLLLVEDNPDLRGFLRQSLSQTYQIMEASNGQEAIDMIANRQPDLVLSDIMMPVMRGDDLCKTLKNDIATSHIPVILLTALNDKENIIHGLEVKADNYIVKPFDVDILKASIANVLANKETIRQRFAQLDYHTADIGEEVPGLDLDQAFISEVTETIRKNLSNDFNVDALCAAFHMSRSSFYNKVRALTGHSPSDFVRQVRMHEAATLLRSRKHTVAEVSDLLGYSDPKYFTDIFKKHYGMTPSAYMKQEKP